MEQAQEITATRRNEEGGGEKRINPTDEDDLVMGMENGGRDGL